MKQFTDLMKNIRDNGHSHPDRTGTGRRSIFGCQIRFKMSDGFPLVTTRYVRPDNFIKEMLWFIKGDTNADHLVEQGVNIWNSWKLDQETINVHIDYMYNLMTDGLDEETEITEDQKNEIKSRIKEDLTKGLSRNVGHIGPMYGYNWRFAPSKHIKGIQQAKNLDEVYEIIRKANDPLSEEVNANQSSYIDQLQVLITNLKEKPYSARHVVTSWLPEYVPNENLSPKDNVVLGFGALAACHAIFQCFVHPGETEDSPKKLSLQMYQRKSHCASI